MKIAAKKERNWFDNFGVHFMFSLVDEEDDKRNVQDFFSAQHSFYYSWATSGKSAWCLGALSNQLQVVFLPFQSHCLLMLHWPRRWLCLSGSSSLVSMLPLLNSTGRAMKTKLVSVGTACSGSTYFWPLSLPLYQPQWAAGTKAEDTIAHGNIGRTRHAWRYPGLHWLPFLLQFCLKTTLHHRAITSICEC